MRCSRNSKVPVCAVRSVTGSRHRRSTPPTAIAVSVRSQRVRPWSLGSLRIFRALPIPANRPPCIDQACTVSGSIAAAAAPRSLSAGSNRPPRSMSRSPVWMTLPASFRSTTSGGRAGCPGSSLPTRSRGMTMPGLTAIERRDTFRRSCPRPLARGGISDDDNRCARSNTRGACPPCDG